MTHIFLLKMPNLKAPSTQKNTKSQIALGKQSTLTCLASHCLLDFFSLRNCYYTSVFNDLSELLCINEIKDVAFDLNPSLSCRSGSVVH